MAAPEAGASKAASKKAPDLVLTRVFDAPRELVFKVWTDPKHVAQWWGPSGFKTTIHEMDVRPGGRWRYAMSGPNGNDYPFDGVYVEVVEPERLVFDGAIHMALTWQVWQAGSLGQLGASFSRSRGTSDIVRKDWLLSRIAK